MTFGFINKMRQADFSQDDGFKEKLWNRLNESREQSKIIGFVPLSENELAGVSAAGDQAMVAKVDSTGIIGDSLNNRNPSNGNSATACQPGKKFGDYNTNI